MTDEYDGGNGGDDGGLFGGDSSGDGGGLFSGGGYNAGSSGGASLESQLEIKDNYAPSSGLDSAAMKNAAMQKEREELVYSREERKKEQKKILADVQQRAYDSTRDSIEKRMSNSINPVTGLRKAVYETAKFLNIDLYRRDVLSNKNRLEKLVVAMQDATRLYEEELTKRVDNDEAVPLSEKGLKTQFLGYKKICRGLEREMNKVEKIQQDYEKEKTEHKEQIQAYTSIVESEKSTETEKEDARNMIEFYTSETERIIDELEKLDMEKAELEDEIEDYDSLATCADTFKKQYELNIDVGKKVVKDALNTVRLMDVYLKNCDGYKSLLNYQSQIEKMDKGIEQLGKATDEAHGRIVEGVKAMHGRNEQRRRGSRMLRYSDDLNSVDTRRRARRSTEIEKIREKYR